MKPCSYDALILHNILWPRYIGAIFSELSKLSIANRNIRIDFIHLAETEDSRIGLGVIDTKIHDYPYSVLFKGSINKVSKLKMAIELGKICLKSNHKVVILPGYHLTAYWIALFLSIAKGKKIGVFCDSTASDNTQNRFKSTLKRIFFKQCDFALAYGTESANYLKDFGVHESKIFSPCNASALPKQQIHISELTEARVRLRPQANEIRILYVGRLSSEKNLDRLLTAVSRVRNRLEGLRLRICGSGPEESNLKEKSAALGLSKIVTFLGPKTPEELATEYLTAKALVLPSLSEPWGLVVNEAFYFGCAALVSSNCGCASDLISSKTGIIVNPIDTCDIEEGLIKLVTHIESDIITPTNCRMMVEQFSPLNAASVMYSAISQEGK